MPGLNTQATQAKELRHDRSGCIARMACGADVGVIGHSLQIVTLSPGSNDNGSCAQHMERLAFRQVAPRWNAFLSAGPTDLKTGRCSISRQMASQDRSLVSGSQKLQLSVGRDCAQAGGRSCRLHMPARVVIPNGGPACTNGNHRITGTCNGQ